MLRKMTSISVKEAWGYFKAIDFIALFSRILAALLKVIILPAEVRTGVLSMVVRVAHEDHCEERSTGVLKKHLERGRVLN